MSDNPRFAGPVGRLKSCIENWPECFSGDYNPSCCRFPKSCSCDAWSDDDPELYEPFHVAEKTAPVSDNPADSLRRELAEAIHRSGPMHFDRCMTRCSGPTAMEQEQASCVLSLLEAARADGRERLEQENQQLRERLEAIRRDPTLALVTNVKPLKVMFDDGD